MRCINWEGRQKETGEQWCMVSPFSSKAGFHNGPASKIAYNKIQKILKNLLLFQTLYSPLTVVEW